MINENGRQKFEMIRFQLTVDVIISAFARKSLAERTGLEPAREILYGIATRRGYHFATSPNLKSKSLERAIGFEPMIDDFADRRLCPLGYTRKLIFDFRLPICDLIFQSINLHSKIRN